MKGNSFGRKFSYSYKQMNAELKFHWSQWVVSPKESSSFRKRLALQMSRRLLLKNHSHFDSGIKHKFFVPRLLTLYCKWLCDCLKYLLTERNHFQQHQMSKINYAVHMKHLRALVKYNFSELWNLFFSFLWKLFLVLI